MSDQIIPPNRRVLLVDDNVKIHADFRKIFEAVTAGATDFDLAEAALYNEPVRKGTDHLAFEMDSAFQGEEGARLASEASACGRPYALAFVDMRMPPGWDGMKTIGKLWEVCPDLQVVICTAYSDQSWEEILERFGQTDRLLILKKPFENVEVLQLANGLTEKWRLIQQANLQTEHLERLVAARTHELKTANRALEAEMVGRATVEEMLRHAQKMDAVGQLAAGVAHDFDNLLSVIRSYSGLLLDNALLDANSREAVREMDSAAERATALSRQLLTFGRRQVMRPEYLDLREVAGQLSELLHRSLGEAFTLEIENAAFVPVVFADRGMLEQVILNLVLNARDAMCAGGRLLLSTTAVHFAAAEAGRNPAVRPGRFACLSVADGGSGITPEVLPRLFEPFFTTKETGKGTGLGLATVHGIVQQHEGWIEVESTPDCGATFKVFLPESVRPTEDAATHTARSETVGGNETILLVEDDPSLRTVARLVLQKFGYRVYMAESGAAALTEWPTYAAEVDLLVADTVMPGGISGRELAVRLRKDKPGLKVIHTSAYSLELAGTSGGREDGGAFLPKPYSCASLAAIVRDSLDRDHRSFASTP